MKEATVDDYFSAPELVVVKDPALVSEIRKSFGSVKVSEARKTLEDLAEKAKKLEEAHEKETADLRKKYSGRELSDEEKEKAQDEIYQLEKKHKKESRAINEQLKKAHEQSQWVS